MVGVDKHWRGCHDVSSRSSLHPRSTVALGWGPGMWAMASVAASPGSPGVEIEGVLRGKVDGKACPPNQSANSSSGSIRAMETQILRRAASFISI